MAKTETVCSCGAAYDSAGVCTRCGKKRPRSAGYRIFHGVLCILATLLLLFCINCTAFVRHQLKYRRLTKALRNEVRLSDASAPFGSETVADYIRREYVSDEAVTADDVAAAVDGMKLPAFAADKLEAYADMLRGKTDKVVKVQPDEVIAQLESSEKDLYSKNLLIIDDSDKEDIRSSLAEPLGELNRSLDRVYGSPALRALARFRVSAWRILLDIALMGLLLWRLAVVRRNGGKDASTALKSMGFAVLIPNALVFLGCVVTGLISAFAKDGKVGLLPLGRAIRMPLWLSSMLGVSVGALLLICYLLALNAKLKKESAAIPEPSSRWYGTKMQSVEVPELAPDQKFCMSCGKVIPASAGFCIYCGKSQSAPYSGKKASETEPAPEAPDAPEMTDTAETPETPDLPQP